MFKNLRLWFRRLRFKIPAWCQACGRRFNLRARWRQYDARQMRHECPCGHWNFVPRRVYRNWAKGLQDKHFTQARG